MKQNGRFLSTIVIAFLGCAAFALAQTLPPTTINYQGRVSVAGGKLEGTGYFKFLLYAKPDDKRLWSNDSSHTGSAALELYEPEGNVSAVASEGLFSVDLGNPQQSNQVQINSSVFFNGSGEIYSEVYLRIWFSTTATGPFVKLSPDRRLSSVPFALVAGTVAKGAISPDKLAPGSALANIGSAGIGSSFLAPGSAAANLGPSSIGSGLLAPGAVTSDKIDPLAFTALSSTLMQNAPVPTFTALEGIAARDAVAVTKDGSGTPRLQKANGAVGSRFAFFGFAQAAAAAGAPVSVQQFGAMSGFSNPNLVPGSSYYLDAINGKITGVYPAANPTYVGYALSADTLFVDPFGVTKKWSNQNYWGNGSDGALSTTASLISLPVPVTRGAYDGDVVVKQYTSLTIEAGHTMTTAQPCRGLVIYVDGNCTINGTLTMTKRGASADPAQDVNSISATGIRLARRKSGATESLPASDVGGAGLGGVGSAWRTVESLQPGVDNNGKIYTVARQGGTGGVGNAIYNGGNPGNSLINGTGGGGSSSGSSSYPGESGAPGTCFSGGSAAGAPSSGAGALPNAPGSYFGGPGGRGNNAEAGNWGGGGGAGNPGGEGGSGGAGNGANGETGTGGLLMLFVRGNLTIGSSASISANGAIGGIGQAGAGSGGGAGGGRIIILHAGSLANGGSVPQANGGQGGQGNYQGKNGGAGDITIDKIDP